MHTVSVSMKSLHLSGMERWTATYCTHSNRLVLQLETEVPMSNYPLIFLLVLTTCINLLNEYLAWRKWNHCSLQSNHCYVWINIATLMRSSIIEYSPTTTNRSSSTTTTTLDVCFIASRAAPAIVSIYSACVFHVALTSAQSHCSS